MKINNKIHLSRILGMCSAGLMIVGIWSGYFFGFGLGACFFLTSLVILAASGVVAEDVK
jgi:hypothetical protein